jgi:hypothetical protein
MVNDQQEQLPRGIWYEAPKRRFRVRKYHNGVSYLKGYYRTFDEARVALTDLESYLSTIPKQRKKKAASPSPDPTLSGTAKSVQSREQKMEV